MQQGNKELANKAMSGVTAELMKTDKTFTVQQKPCSFSLSHTLTADCGGMLKLQQVSVYFSAYLVCLPDSPLLFLTAVLLKQ